MRGTIQPHGLYSKRGGRQIAAPTCRRGVVPSICGRHTGSFLRRDNRKVPGTAHRPFPTVSPVGGTVHLHRFYSPRCLAMNHRRYIGWFHSTIQVVFETWRAADCRPYRRGSIQSARVIIATLPERHIGRSLRFRWWVDSFNHTGYKSNVAGGRLPPLRTRWWVVPFNHTGYNCHAAERHTGRSLRFR